MSENDTGIDAQLDSGHEQQEKGDNIFALTIELEAAKVGSGVTNTEPLAVDPNLLFKISKGVAIDNFSCKTRKTVSWRTPLKDIIYVETTTYSEERKIAAAYREKGLPRAQRRALAGSKKSLKRSQWVKKSTLPNEEEIEERQKAKEREYSAKTENKTNNSKVESRTPTRLRVEIVESKSGRKCFFVIKNSEEVTADMLIQQAKTKLKIKGKKIKYALSTCNKNSTKANGTDMDNESPAQNPSAFQESLRSGSVFYLIKT
uniref:Uncharacterized protein n=1 Tax=Aplanochytrium stocchinoi TaxID=215587 RepID=A0A7S3V1N5_9STRA|mmetsp:Transcript_3612/g.4532  ORF Transcript_3612/g.4532 Transcript_3612/m.4532 type:complete len:260 (+) Transcript_3612:740-1519(+)|eukprot:CAMPEP_0204860278 /NCGR_PEP_ID=MMETSP1347-20130617/24216_1 /ASSEMBLY_ACC=CAM_ASM_000690 /TAXON_ID=215587 /ORGANISM="Aplanochytrium stocchinoi, Strain GSBS06" /LENGTH=259 /DNA_ID=CAMNT_0052008949 /DNA_START=614 /DNA_END=1393 /DNA_ORIENTATION=+